MSFEAIIEVLRNILDIAIVWTLFYVVLKNVKGNIKLSLIFKIILLIIVLRLASDWLGLVTVGLVVEYILQWLPLALIVIFQPEIRSIIEKIGRGQLLGKHKTLTVDEREQLVYQLVNALDYMKKAKIGSLIVIERNTSLQDYISNSTNLYADVTSELLISLFYPNNPLSDGGVIIEGDKISCAGAVFPTSTSLKINKRLGTRHRAAVGITEETDAISIIVSEETGRLSIAIKGELYYNVTIEDARILLIDELRPKVEELDEENEEENYEQK